MYTYLGRSGHINDYDVFISGDVVMVINEQRIVTKQKVTGLAAFIAKAKDFRLGWANLPDFEVIYLYDKGDRYFGYAVNLQDAHLSEWGYAPFAREADEDAA